MNHVNSQITIENVDKDGEIRQINNKFFSLYNDYKFIVHGWIDGGMDGGIDSADTINDSKI